MSRRSFNRRRNAVHFIVAVGVALALALAIAGCATTTTTTTPPSSTAPAPAVSTGADVERCQGAGGVWRNGMCTTMGGGGY